MNEFITAPASLLVALCPLPGVANKRASNNKQKATSSKRPLLLLPFLLLPLFPLQRASAAAVAAPAAGPASAAPAVHASAAAVASPAAAALAAPAVPTAPYAPALLLPWVGCSLLLSVYASYV